MKPELLLAWGNPYNFDGVIVPLVPRLAPTYRVYVMLVDYHLAPRVMEQLKRWTADATISGYSIVPEYRDALRLHWFMAAEVRRLRRRNFCALVSLSMMQVWERYLAECALPPEAVRLCFFTHLTNLLEHEALVRGLLEGRPAMGPPVQSATPDAPIAPKPSALRALGRLARTPGIRARWQLAGQYARALLPAGDFKERIDRVLLPRLFVGKSFELRNHDWLTQLGTDQFDAVAFLDPLEARAYAALYGNPEMFVVEHPVKGNCRCGVSHGAREAILSPLSGFMGSDDVPAPMLELYRRDLGAAMGESGAREVHLRLHPRETGRWPQQLVAFLGLHGIEARIVDPSRPIREIACDYAGVVGFASAALRDARGSCDEAFVVGMTAVSKVLFSNPQFIFGDSEGIGWIGEDGSYAPDTFRRGRFAAPVRPSITTLIEQLRQRKNDLAPQGR